MAVRGALHSLFLAAAEQHAQITVVDFVGDEDAGDAIPVLDLARRTGARYVRASSLDAVVRDLSALVEVRTATAAYREPHALLVLYGLQRAVSLHPHDPWRTSYPEDGQEDQPSVAQLLASLMTAGPEVGVHVVVDVDHSRSVETRLGADRLGELLLRVAGSAVEPKDLSLVSSAGEEQQPLRLGQLLLGDHLKNKTKRVRGYDVLRVVEDGEGQGGS